MTIIYKRNKFLLIAVLLVGGWFYLPMLFKALTYKKTTGVYLNHEYVERLSVTDRPDYVFEPTIRFIIDGKKYLFKSSDFLHDEYDIGWEVPVKYNPHKPSQAFVNTFLGFWAPPLLYVFPIIVCLAGLILAIEMRIAAQKNRMIEDSGIIVKVEEEV